MVWTTPRRFRPFSSPQSRDESVEAELDLRELIVLQPKLVLQGQIGSGKTTALRYLAHACLEQQIVAEKIPLTFQLSAQDFSSQIQQAWECYNLSSEQLETIIQGGYLLLLLDGFEQLNECDRSRLRNQLNQWNQQYPHNSVTLTCRPDCDEAQLYGFAVAELATFSEAQVKTFVQRWFSTVEQDATPMGAISDPLEPIPLRKTTDTCQADKFLAEWRCSPLLSQGATPLILHSLCLSFQKQGRLGTNKIAPAQTLLELLLFRWERVSGSSEQLSGLSQELLDALSHLAIHQSLTPESPYGVPHLAHSQRRAANAVGGLGEAWSISQLVLRKLCQNYGLIQEVSPEQYCIPNDALRAYLCALHLSNLSSQESLLPVLLETLQSFPLEIGVSIFSTVLSLATYPSRLAQAMMEYWEALPIQDPALKPLINWLYRKTEQSDDVNPAFVQVFYYMLARQGAAKAHHCLPPEVLSELPQSLIKDLLLEQCIQEIRQLSTKSSTIQLNALKAHLEQLRDYEFETELTTFGPQRELGNDSLTSAQWQAWWNSEGEDARDQFVAHCQTHYGLGYQWPWPRASERYFQQYDQALLVLFFALGESPAVSIRELLMAPSAIGKNMKKFKQHSIASRPLSSLPSNRSAA
ncbi:MAG: NACHT domain-containing protein [Acaryochloridaceae cyanobacterium RL_2_7]|nr:NACHT domain-containing protein [Acaryochloridaceae cyanobacterium RL_2_7]